MPAAWAASASLLHALQPLQQHLLSLLRLRLPLLPSLPLPQQRLPQQRLPQQPPLLLLQRWLHVLQAPA